MCFFNRPVSVKTPYEKYVDGAQVEVLKAYQANKKQCAERVFKNIATGFVGRCSRKAGYGENEAFCKQHALRHPKVEVVKAC